jgi:hypothetical protein
MTLSSSVVPAWRFLASNLSPIGTIKIGLLAVGLKHDGNERPHPDKLLSRLRDCSSLGRKLRKSALTQ